MCICWGNQLLTCSQETMSCQHELRGDLHFAVCVVFKGREVGFVFVGVHLFPVPVVSCKGRGGVVGGLKYYSKFKIACF